MKGMKKIFILYCIVLTFVLLFKAQLSVDAVKDTIESIRRSREAGAWNYNLIPFKTIAQQLHNLQIIPRIVIKNLVGNVVAFVPFGFFLPMGFEKMRKCHKTILTGILYIFIIELIQFVCMLGRFDIDDIILNGIGVSCGYALFQVLKPFFKLRG